MTSPRSRRRRGSTDPAMDGAHAPALSPPAAWFHSHAFPDGEVVAGEKPIGVLEKEAGVVFRHGVAGKSVLDIGAWDGWFSFEAERRGAARVLATDHFCWSGPGWRSRRASTTCTTSSDQWSKVKILTYLT